ncbi:MAG: CDP-glycerol glycerophosphotransferase family protein [Candidatus Pacebacteria bacterium]|nr:CDP-glycerol glycerophosphotransferase family protein [Candidatus Paceibacterota bacterium]
MSVTKKTILMPVYDGTITKNLLRTSFLSELIKSGDVCVVIIPPKGKYELYKDEFENPGTVEVESVDAWRHDGIEYAFAYLYKHSIPTTFMKIRQVDWYVHKRQYVRYLCAATLRTMGRFHWWKRVLLWVNYLEPILPETRALYEKWQPDLVFAPTMIPRLEVALMRLARQDGKPIVGMAKSFDNLTSKAYLRIHPDRLIVPNDTGVEEAVHLYDYPRERVSVTGICQYDSYVRDDILEERSAFFAHLGLDPKKKTILYAPAGDWMNANDKNTLALVLGWINDDSIPNTQVLLRLHPAYESATEELIGQPNLIVERPGQRLGELRNYEFGHTDVQHLASSLAYANVIIQTASTLMVEGAIFDTPIIGTAVDATSNTSYWKSIRRYYDREHVVPIVRSGGMWVVHTPEELQTAIQTYLRDPVKDAEERKKAVEVVCYRMDGKSCARTADVLLSLL